MKHEHSSVSSSPASAPLEWNVYNACHVLVATYPVEPAAAAHVACWPALYYGRGPLSPTPVDSRTGPFSLIGAA